MSYKTGRSIGNKENQSIPYFHEEIHGLENAIADLFCAAAERTLEAPRVSVRTWYQGKG